MDKFDQATRIDIKLPTGISTHSDKYPVPSGEDPDKYFQASELNTINSKINENTNDVKDLMVANNKIVDESNKKIYDSIFINNQDGSNIFINVGEFGKSEIEITNSLLNSISGFNLDVVIGSNYEAPYEGKRYRITNKKGNDLTLIHNASYSNPQYNFSLKGAANLIIPNGEIIEFIWKTTGLVETFRSFSETLPIASETVAGKVSVGTQTFGGNKTIVGESTTTGNAFEVQNLAHVKGLEIPNSNVAGVRSIIRAQTSEMYAKSQKGGVAFCGVENTSTVLGYPKIFSFGNNNLWNIETEYFSGYGIAFVNRLAGKAFATSSFYIGSQGAVADNVGIGTNNPVAKLQVDSTTKGFAPPRMTTAQKNAIVTPMAGLMVFDTTLMKLCIFTTAWETITSI